MKANSKKTTFLEYAYDIIRPLLIAPEQFRPLISPPSTAWIKLLDSSFRTGAPNLMSQAAS